MIDRSKGDPLHNGIEFLEGFDEHGSVGSDVGPNGDLPDPDDDPKFRRVVRGFNYQPIGDSVVQVVGKIEEGTIRRVGLRFRVYTRSERPKRTTSQGRVPINCLLITSRRLCGGFISAPCPEVVPIDGSTSVSIVDEQCPEIDPALLTREETAETRLVTAKSILTVLEKEALLAHDLSPTLTSAKLLTETRLPAVKELLRKVQSAMTSSGRSPTRLGAGAVGFLGTDYFKDRLMRLPGVATVLPVRLGQLTEVPEEVVRVFGAGATVGDVLKPTLVTFARRTGLSLAEAAQTRFKLLRARPREG